MPRAHPPEFRRRAVELAWLRDKPVAEIASDLGISDSCLRNWMAQADVDDGHQPGLSSDERAELVALRRKTRVLEMEVEILKCASLDSSGQRNTVQMIGVRDGQDGSTWNVRREARCAVAHVGRRKVIQRDLGCDRAPARVDLHCCEADRRLYPCAPQAPR